MSNLSFVLESRFCDGCWNQAAYISDNHLRGIALFFCEKCEWFRAKQFGCALLVDEGCGCEQGGADCLCGCGGTGRL